MSNDSSGTAALDTLANIVAGYRNAKHAAAQWHETADAFRVEITRHLDEHDAEIGTIDGTPAVKYTPVTQRHLDSKALRRDHPELAERYMTEQTTRRFTVVEP